MARKTETVVSPTQEIELARGSAEAMSQLPADMVLMKMENESIMAMAAARPRNYKAILADIMEQLDAYPSFALEAMYAKPVGKDDNGKQKYARGLSIRFAEAAAEAYGYNRVAKTVEPVAGDDDKVRLTAVFVDYQKGRVWQDSVIVSKWYKTRDGKMMKMPDDRFYDLKVKAEGSKLVREVINRCLPAGFRSEAEGAIRRARATALSPETINKIVGEFSNMKVTLAQLESKVGEARGFDIPVSQQNWNVDDKDLLASLWQAIKDNETTVAEAFGTPGAAPRGQAAQDAPRIGAPATSSRPNAISPADVAPAPAPEAEKAGVAPLAETQITIETFGDAPEAAPAPPAEESGPKPPWNDEWTGNQKLWAAGDAYKLKVQTQDLEGRATYGITIPNPILAAVIATGVIITPDDNILVGKSDDKACGQAASLLFHYFSTLK